jgi:hypothetical protein
MVRWQAPVPLRQVRPELPAALEQVCATCLDKDPRRRYPSARALAEELERIQERLRRESAAAKSTHKIQATAPGTQSTTRANPCSRRPVAAGARLAPEFWDGVAGAAVNLLVLGAGWLLFLLQRLRAGLEIRVRPK